MINRPWVSPQDLKEYTDIDVVKKRTDSRLIVDIKRAENEIIAYCNQDFSDFEELPEEVRIACILTAEAFAYNSIKTFNNVKSESFDDYSYTIDSNLVEIKDLNLSSLLKNYVKDNKAKNPVNLKMRVL